MGRLTDSLAGILGRVGKEGVFFDEMEHPPQLIIGTDHLEIRAWNSLRNSSKSIQRVDFRREDDKLYFTAKQGLASSPDNPRTITFSYSALGISPTDLPEHEMFWMDPDGRRTPLRTERDPDELQ